MNSGTKELTFSNLPIEVILKILRYLSYSEVGNYRRICKSFDVAGKYLLSSSLRRLTHKMEYTMMRNSQFNIWNKRRKRTIMPLRLMLGVRSVLHFSRILGSYDALLSPLMISGTLPPLPGALLDDIDRAVALGKRKNPLIGKHRIGKLNNDIYKFCFTTIKNYQSKPLQIDSSIALQILIDLLDLLPFSTREERIIDSGLQIKWNTPITYSFKEVLVLAERFGSMHITKQRVANALDLYNLYLLAFHESEAVAKYIGVDPMTSLSQILRDAAGVAAAMDGTHDRRLEADEEATQGIIVLEIVCTPQIQSLDQLDVKSLNDFCAKLSVLTELNEI